MLVVLHLLFGPMGFSKLLERRELFAEARWDVGSVERFVKQLDLCLAQLFDQFVGDAVVAKGHLGDVETRGRGVQR